MDYLKRAREGRVKALGKRELRRAETVRAVEFWNDPNNKTSRGPKQGRGLARSVYVLQQKDRVGLASA